MTNKFTGVKKRLLSVLLAVMSVVTMIPAVSASAAENYDGGWAMMNAARTVYSSSSLSTSIGSVSKGEGITVLSSSGSTYYIEYSTSNGAKRGYVSGGVATDCLGYTCVAKVNTTTNLYYGMDTLSFDKAGTVYSGEYVAVIAANAPWAYVEYNTNSGRKRGYMELSKLTTYNQPSWMPNLYDNQGNNRMIPITSTMTVRSGPSAEYPSIGSVNANDAYVGCFYKQSSDTPGYVYAFIRYENTSTGLIKSGFILYPDFNF